MAGLSPLLHVNIVFIMLFCACLLIVWVLAQTRPANMFTGVVLTIRIWVRSDYHQDWVLSSGLGTISLLSVRFGPDPILICPMYQNASVYIVYVTFCFYL